MRGRGVLPVLNSIDKLVNHICIGCEWAKEHNLIDSFDTDPGSTSRDSLNRTTWCFPNGSEKSKYAFVKVEMRSSQIALPSNCVRKMAIKGVSSFLQLT